MAKLNLIKVSNFSEKAIKKNNLDQKNILTNISSRGFSLRMHEKTSNLSNKIINHMNGNFKKEIWLAINT